MLGGIVDGTLKPTPRDTLAALMQQARSSASASGRGGGGAGMLLHALTPASAARGSSGDADGVGDEDVALASPATVAFPLGTTEALAAEVLALLSSPVMRSMGASKARAAAAAGQDAGDGDDDGGDGGAAGGGEAATSVFASLAQVRMRKRAGLQS